MTMIFDKNMDLERLFWR